MAKSKNNIIAQARKDGELKASKLLKISKPLAYKIGIDISNRIRFGQKDHLLTADANTINLDQSAQLDWYFHYLHSTNRISPVCTSGCSGCCKYPIWIAHIEKVSIIDWINTHNLKEYVPSAICLWKEKMDTVASNLRPGFSPYREEYIDRNIKCPFLKDNLCIIYPVRPVSCKTYFAYGLVRDCENKRYAPGTANYECASYNLYKATLSSLIQRMRISYPMNALCIHQLLFAPPILLPYLFD